MDKREKITAYVDGLEDKQPVLRFMQDNPSCTLLEIVAAAKHEGKLWRGRMDQLSKKFGLSSTKRKATVNLIDEPSLRCAEVPEDEEDSDSEDEDVPAITGNTQMRVGWENCTPRKPKTRYALLIDVCARCYERGTNRTLPHKL